MKSHIFKIVPNVICYQFLLSYLSTRGVHYASPEPIIYVQLGRIYLPDMRIFHSGMMIWNDFRNSTKCNNMIALWLYIIQKDHLNHTIDTIEAIEEHNNFNVFITLKRTFKPHNWLGAKEGHKNFTQSQN